MSKRWFPMRSMDEILSGEPGPTLVVYPVRVAFGWRRFVSWRWWVSRYRTRKWVDVSDAALADRGLPTSQDAHGMATFVLDDYRARFPADV